MNFVSGFDYFSNSKLWQPFHARKQVFFIFLGTSEARWYRDLVWLVCLLYALLRSDRSTMGLGSPFFLDGVTILDIHSTGEFAGTSSSTPILQKASSQAMNFSLKCHGTKVGTCSAKGVILGSTISLNFGPEILGKGRCVHTLKSEAMYLFSNYYCSLSTSLSLNAILSEMGMVWTDLGNHI